MTAADSVAASLGSGASLRQALSAALQQAAQDPTSPLYAAEVPAVTVAAVSVPATPVPIATFPVAPHPSPTPSPTPAAAAVARMAGAVLLAGALAALAQ